MHARRIYSDQQLAPGAVVTLDGAAAHHVAQVLRMAAGEELVLFDGRGGEYPARLRAVSRREVVAELGAMREVDRESPRHTILVQAVSRAERMDYTIQKAVELGVSEIVPVHGERSVVRLDEERAARRVAHWQAIAIAAAQQSGRTRIPPVAPLSTLPRWLAGAGRDGTRLWLQPAAPRGLADLDLPPGPVSLIIGPEGGFAPAEHALLADAGCTSVALGPRILRTETAALVALSILQARWGDLASARAGAGGPAPAGAG